MVLYAYPQHCLNQSTIIILITAPQDANNNGKTTIESVQTLQTQMLKKNFDLTQKAKLNNGQIISFITYIDVIIIP